MTHLLFGVNVQLHGEFGRSVQNFLTEYPLQLIAMLDLCPSLEEIGSVSKYNVLLAYEYACLLFRNANPGKDRVPLLEKLRPYSGHVPPKELLELSNSEEKRVVISSRRLNGLLTLQ